MDYSATLTSKRQFTIPSALYSKLNLKTGEKLLVREKNGMIELEPSRYLVERLAGSLKVPKRFLGLTDDQIVKKAKQEYFKRRFLRYSK